MVTVVTVAEPPEETVLQPGGTVRLPPAWVEGEAEVASGEVPQVEPSKAQVVLGLPGSSSFVLASFQHPSNPHHLNPHWKV